MASIAIVEDDLELSNLFVQLLKLEGHDVYSAPSAARFLEEIARNTDRFDLIISDYQLPDMDALELFQQCRGLNLTGPFVVMTAFKDIEKAVTCMKAGISDYLAKPIKPEVLLQKVSRYLEHRSLQNEVTLTRIERKVVAQSKSMHEVLAKLSRVAASRASILFSGESGTGKELLARVIHEVSRRKGAFVGVNVSAVPETLFEAEFFGYKKGSFTDASRDHDGYARQAEGGTLFLDEVGDLSQTGQAKLLRLLEERVVHPLGSKTIVPVDFRLISASNKNLEEMVRKGDFREDLYYRVAVVRMKIPPLRERPEDIIPIARSLLSQLANEEGLKVRDFTPEAQSLLLGYSWPGNVREIRNRIHEAILESPDRWIDADHLHIDVEETAEEQSLAHASAKADFEKRYVLRLLKAAKGRIVRAAEISGLTRKALYDMMKRQGITPDKFR